MLWKKTHIDNTENSSLTTRSEIPGSFQKGKCSVIAPSDLEKYINSEKRFTLSNLVSQEGLSNTQMKNSNKYCP